MIDLRKPLEGVPGLLLMAALILFGAGVGIAFALGFTWIPMSDALANFLGGVIGACLGAALAVLGAVYVQHLSAVERMRPTMHSLSSAVARLSTLLGVMYLMVDRMAAEARAGVAPTAPSSHLDTIEQWLSRVPDGADLPSELHNDILNMKELVTAFVQSWRTLERAPITFPMPDGYFDVLDLARDAVRGLQERLPSLEAPMRIGRPA